MNFYNIAACAIAVAVYALLCIQVLQRKVPQNFATWILWALLDSIAAASLIVQEGNFWIPVFYALGSGAIVFSVLKTKTAGKWTNFESMIVVLVVICIIAWALSGPQMATIASTTALAIAGIPQVMDVYKKPFESPLFVWI